MPYFHAIHYKVTDEEIKTTGKREFYEATDRAEALEKCLYTHHLHNRNAYSFGGSGMPPHFIVMCQTCGQIAVVPEPRLVQVFRSCDNCRHEKENDDEILCKECKEKARTKKKQ